MPSYHLVEPHPTAGPSNCMHTGRGGAGNTTKVSEQSINSRNSLVNTVSASSLASATPTVRSKFVTGRGGAGNVRSAKEVASASYSFDAAIAAAGEGRPTYHTGRGGAGNYRRPEQAGSSDRHMSVSSVDSAGSSRSSGFMSRLSGVFERN